jgi:hypothetical protein
VENAFGDDVEDAKFLVAWQVRQKNYQPKNSLSSLETAIKKRESLLKKG